MLVAGQAGAQETSSSVLHCVPALPAYCANVHIGCSGRSSMKTTTFEILVHPKGTRVQFATGTVWRADVSRARGEMVLRRHESREWIRVDRNGTFSHRLYRDAQPLMTHGTCRDVS